MTPPPRLRPSAVIYKLHACMYTQKHSECVKQPQCQVCTNWSKIVLLYTSNFPQLEYAAPIWHPYNETQTAKVEKVQRTAARWTCRRWRNSSSVGDMLVELEWPSLQSRRQRSSLTFFYKIHSQGFSWADFGAHYRPLSQLKKCVKFPNFQIKNTKIINKSLYICCG